MNSFFVPLKPMSINAVYAPGYQGKGIVLKPEARQYKKDLFRLLPPKDQVKIFDKMTLIVTMYFKNADSDLDNPLKMFIDGLQYKYKFNDKLIHRIISDKIVVEDGAVEGTRFSLVKYNSNIKQDSISSKFAGIVDNTNTLKFLVNHYTDAENKQEIIRRSDILLKALNYLEEELRHVQ